MEKEMCRRHLTREGMGCVWVFMSMFDIRHGGSNHKLLMDKKRGSKRITGIESKEEKQLSTCDCEKSVKKLIEEEMDEKTQQECDTECRGSTMKRRSRTYIKTNEDDHEESDADAVNDDSEESFSELIKRMIAQKESEIESCNSPVEALEVLDCKEESFLNIGTSPVSGDCKKHKETSSQCTQTIVVLKPEPNCLGLVSSPGTQAKAKNKRFGSRFILSRIRRRLKSAKNPCNAQHDSDPDSDALSSNMSQTSCLGEEVETNKEDTTFHGSEDSKKSMCSIYTAAKKHLSEMLAEGDMDVDSQDKEVPRILGKILALPEFSTPQTTPRVTLSHEKPKTQQCSSEDYSETLLGLDSNKHEETASTSDLQLPGDAGEEEKIVLDSLSAETRIHQDAYVDEHEHTQPLGKETFDEKPSQCSPPMSESQDNATDVPGKSSPVSVLEPFFTDDDISPNCSRFSSAETRLKPLRIRFEELDSPRHDVRTRMDDKELALAYIQEVVTSSELNWEELLTRSFYSEQVLEQALMDDIDFCPTNFCNDKKLLFDCINEVLEEFCRHGPWLSFTKPLFRFVPDMENAVQVVQEEVYWHLLPLPSPHTLDQIVSKDMARTGCWMDLRFDIGSIGSQTGEIILEELLEETISSCTDLFQSTKPQCTSCDSLSFTAYKKDTHDHQEALLFTLV